MSDSSGFLPSSSDPFFSMPGLGGALQDSLNSPGGGDKEGTPWRSGDRITLSFAPDGTRVSKYQSNLFQSFSSLLSATQLQEQILLAFQEWSRVAGVNVGLVNDSGAQFGASGPWQGDLRFGDIRIGAVPMDTSVYAITVRNDVMVAGTWGGDILFNSNAAFTSVSQFYAVALHEAGHALGLQHSTVSGAVMNPAQLNSVLTPTDAQALRARYGGRNLDRMESFDKRNDARKDASRIDNPGSLGGRIPLVVYGDLHSAPDVDWYELHPISGYTGKLSFEWISSGISLLKGRLSVYDESGDLVAESVASGTRGSRLKITIPSAVEGETYYARVSAADLSLHAVGSYALVATFDDNVKFSAAYIDQVARGDYANLRQSDVREVFINHPLYLFAQDLQTNDSFLLADTLKTTPGYADSQHYQVHGSFSYLNDLDFMTFRSPSFLRSGDVLTVVLDTMEQGKLVPRLTVFDSSQRAMSSNVLVNINGQLVMQVTGIGTNQDYYVRASADTPGDNYSLGNYTLTVRFDQLAVTLKHLGAGVVTPAQPRRFHSLYVAETQLMRFSLYASGMPRNLGQVWMTIFDPQGGVVYRALTFQEETRTGQNVVMRPGSYSIMLSFAGSAAALATGMGYWIKGDGVTDPIGPELLAPGEKPFKKDQGSNTYTYPGGIQSASTFITVQGNNVPVSGTIQNPPQVSANAWYWRQAWLSPTVPVV